MRSIIIRLVVLLPLLTFASFSMLSIGTAEAPRSGCHRYHSCPSDTGSYTCGDLGDATYCPKATPQPTSNPQPRQQPRSPRTSTGSTTALTAIVAHGGNVR